MTLTTTTTACSTVRIAALDPDICADADGDGCDDCAVGTDGSVRWPTTTRNDGTDADGDGICSVTTCATAIR